jgi:hypothetical protein
MSEIEKNSGAAALPTLRDAYLLPLVAESPVGVRDYTARIVLAGMRRRQSPDRPTWVPLDGEPVPAPSRVLDGDGDVWRREASGLWSMAGFDPDWHEPQAGKRLTWSALVREYGPVTGEAQATDVAAAAAESQARLIAAIDAVGDCADPGEFDHRLSRLLRPPS